MGAVNLYKFTTKLRTPTYFQNGLRTGSHLRGNESFFTIFQMMSYDVHIHLSTLFLESVLVFNISSLDEELHCERQTLQHRVRHESWLRAPHTGATQDGMLRGVFLFFR